VTPSPATGGALGRPADPFQRDGRVLGRPGPLWAAAVAAIALHAVLLAARPGVVGSRHPASAAPVMAVRLLQMASPAAALALAPASVAPSATVEAAAIEQTSKPVTPAAVDPLVASARSGVAAAVAASGSTGHEARTGGQALASPAAASEGQAGGQRTLAAAPDYAFGIALDPGPRPLDDIEPDYTDPINLREGVVVLRVLISATGHVDDVAVVRSAPAGVFDQAAIDAFAKARFSPGLAAGAPVKSQITVEINFVPINRGARVSGRTY
jgi:periplasmic protein TonB